MDNMEDVLMELNHFEKKEPPSVISPVLEEYLVYIAKSGTTLFPWAKIKPLLKMKLEKVIDGFNLSSNHDDLPAVPNVDQFSFKAVKEKVFQQLEQFNGIPFTVQRLCELLTNPKKHYKRIDKFMRALEKNMLVVSTIEPVAVVKNNPPLSNVMNGNISPAAAPANLKLPLTENDDSDQPVKKSARLSSEGDEKDKGSSKTEAAADQENMEVDEDIDQPNQKDDSMRADSDASPLSDTPTADMEVSPAPELPENDRTSEDKTPSLVSPNDSAVTEDLTTSTSEDRAIDSNSSVQIEQPEEASMQPETPQKMEEEDVEAVKDLNVESDTSDAADTSKSSQDERVLSPGEGEAGPCDSNDDNSKENQSQIAMSPSSILATSALASPSSASSPSISNPADSQPSPSISQQDSGTVATSDSPESNPPESTDQNGDKNSSTAEPDKTELAEQGPCDSAENGISGHDMEANSTPKDINAADEKEDRPDVSQSPAIVDAVDATSTTTPLTPSEVKSSSESTQKPEEANSTAEQKEEVSTNSTLV